MMIPKRTDLKTWAASMVIDFPNDNIPLFLPITTEDKKAYKLWGSFLVQENSFANEGAPGPQVYKEPNDWAINVYRSMLDFA